MVLEDYLPFWDGGIFRGYVKLLGGITVDIWVNRKQSQLERA